MRFKIQTFAFFLLFIDASAQTQTEYYKFSHDLDTELQNDTTAWKYQMGATSYSISGYYQKALETWNKNGVRKPRTSKEDSLLFSALKPESAKGFIINLSKNERILIINEAHHNAKHRTFTKSLLQGLYDNGYKYLGLEALTDTFINNRKFPVMESGFYTREPEFGNLISEALKIGFTLFGYEASEGKNGRDREIEQAQNIKKFMDAHPEGKVLIHCGYAHVYENNYKPWEKAMAGRLKEFSGIDPFTINQETFTEKVDPELNHPFVNMVTGTDPVVLLGREGKAFDGLSLPKQTDIVVIHPQTKYINNRPDWLTIGKKPYSIPATKFNDLPALVLAYREGEYEKNGVPADIIETTEQTNGNVLYLFPGVYTIVLKNSNYKVVDTFKVVIE